MSYTSRVLTAMRFDQPYAVSDIAAITHIDEKAVSDCLHLLTKGGLVECVQHNHWRKNRKYKSRQRALL